MCMHDKDWFLLSDKTPDKRCQEEQCWDRTRRHDNLLSHLLVLQIPDEPWPLRHGYFVAVATLLGRESQHKAVHQQNKCKPPIGSGANLPEVDLEAVRKELLVAVGAGHLVWQAVLAELILHNAVCGQHNIRLRQLLDAGLPLVAMVHHHLQQATQLRVFADKHIHPDFPFCRLTHFWECMRSGFAA